MRRTTTEEFDGEGRLIKRTVVEDSAEPVILPLPGPYRPNDATPWVVPPNSWQSPANIGGCSACALSGICNCVNPPGAPRITCNVNA